MIVKLIRKHGEGWFIMLTQGNQTFFFKGAYIERKSDYVWYAKMLKKAIKNNNDLIKKKR